MSILDNFWVEIDAQLEALRTARTGDDVDRILNGFFGGSGGDGTVYDSLREAGWSPVWMEASYYWCMRAPNGDFITYVEGDVYRGNQAPLLHNEEN